MVNAKVIVIEFMLHLVMHTIQQIIKYKKLLHTFAILKYITLRKNETPIYLISPGHRKSKYDIVTRLYGCVYVHDVYMFMVVGQCST